MELANSIYRERERKSMTAMALGESWAGKEGGWNVWRAEARNECQNICVSPLNKTFTSTLDINSNLTQVQNFSPFVCLFLFEKKKPLLNI